MAWRARPTRPLSRPNCRSRTPTCVGHPTTTEGDQTCCITQLGFEDRLGLLVEREASERQSRLLTARLRRAKLRFPDAVPEDINYREPRGLDRALLARLLAGEWIRAHQNVILVAPTGLGKSWLACALVNQACRQGFSACYLRMPKFNEEMAIANGSGG